jgi:hypothetical protein
MPLIDFRQARSEVRLAALLGLLGWRARERHGAQVRGPCPVHGSSSPRSRSFSGHLERGIWQCFRCGASGNALELGARRKARSRQAGANGQAASTLKSCLVQPGG